VTVRTGGRASRRAPARTGHAVGGRRPAVLLCVVSALTLIGLVVAVPLLLWATAGSPLAHWSLPGGRGRVPQAGIDPRLVAHWLGHSALVLAWIAWGWMTACVIIEMRASITGRPRTRLPASRTMQSVVACIVGTALTIAAINRPTPGTMIPAHSERTAERMPSIRVIDDLDRYWEDITAGRETDGRHQDSSAPGGGVVLVSGSGEHFIPPEAHSQEGRSSPGTMPVRSPTVLKIPRAAQAPHHVVAPRETLWSIALDELGSATRWREIAGLNYGLRQADGGALDRRHWVVPGWLLRLPSEEDSERPNGAKQVVRSRPGSVMADGVKISASRSPSPGPSAPMIPPMPSAPMTPLAPFGAGVVGEGVASLLDRMRRVQQRYRRTGEFIRLPTEGPRLIEQRLRMGEDGRTVDEVDAAIRLACRTRTHHPSGPPRVSGVRVTAEQIEVLFDSKPEPGEHVRPVSGTFERRDGVYVVERGRLTCEPPVPPGAPPPAPLLVTAGRDDDAIVMVNLECLGSLSVDGDPLACEDFVRGMALELATSYWAGQFDTVLLGFGAEFERFPRVASVSRVDALLEELRGRVRRGGSSMQAAGFGTFADARCHGDRGDWDPLVVVCGPTSSQESVLEMVEIAAEPESGTMVVAIGRLPKAARTLQITPGQRRPSMELLGSVVSPQLIDSVELGEVGALLDEVSDRRSVARSIAPYDALTVRLPETEDAVDLDSEPQHGGSRRLERDGEERGEIEVEVCVLGPVEVRGALHPFTRAWAKELVVYLAMHPKGATNDAWATALWPDRLMAPSSLHSTASVARRALGKGRHGDDHLPRSHGRLALAPTVGTDWDRFVVRCEAGTAASMRSALELVRGRPFEGLRASDWPVLEGISPAIEATVVDVSGRLAGALLRSGDPAGSEWAARKGLLVSPYDERLYRMLMRAADSCGNPAGVEALMDELIRLVADDIEPLDSVHPSTLELYRNLTRHRTRRRLHDGRAPATSRGRRLQSGFKDP
jgi:DNA-binding SARP family transcriptional activator